MKSEEWDKKAEEYERRVKEIIIVDEISPAYVKSLIAQIDEVLTEASFDFARVKAAVETIERMNKVNRQQYFLQAKEGDVKISDKAADAIAAVKALGENQVAKENEANRRYIFMETVLNILKAKREMLVTDAGVLKLESNV